MGLRAGKGAASAYRRGAEVWKVLRAALIAAVGANARAPDESNLEAMLEIGVWLRRQGWMCRWSRVEMDGRMGLESCQRGSLDVTFIVAPIRVGLLANSSAAGVQPLVRPSRYNLGGLMRHLFVHSKPFNTSTYTLTL